VRHPQYGKLIKRKTICYAHDEGNVSKKGDLVEIEESAPMSKLKRWKLIRVVTKGRDDMGQTVDEPQI
jgi:small subunit ribosomal protein S17